MKTDNQNKQHKVKFENQTRSDNDDSDKHTINEQESSDNQELQKSSNGYKNGNQMKVWHVCLVHLYNIHWHLTLVRNVSNDDEQTNDRDLKS